MTRQREKVANENADLRAIIEKAIEMVNTPGTTAETLPKAINAKIMQRDEFHEATLKKLDVAKAEIARLIQLDATNRNNLERTHKALVESQLAHKAAQREVETLRAELAKRDERLAALEWRPVSVKPTREDADEGGKVIWTNGTSYLEIDWNDIDGMHPSWKWWRPFSPPPAPSPEEIERREFEAYYAEADPRTPQNPFEKEAAWKAWQAARAGKEGK